MTLAEKWNNFRQKLPAEAPAQQILFAQASYLAGAQAAFQILGAASDKPREAAIIIWGSLQQEILQAVGKPKENLVVVPDEKRIII